MSEAIVEHTRLVIDENSYVDLDGGITPATHIRGISAHLCNDDAAAHVLSLYDSTDGATWAILPFGTPDLAPTLTLTVAGKTSHVVVARTARRYLRFAVDVRPTEGCIYIDCYQRPPRGEPQEDLS